MTFQKTARIGKNGEQIVLDLLNSAALTAVKNTDLAKKYDHDIEFQLGKKTKTVEVKFDHMAVKTGNLCIEHHNSKKDAPSGISATKADIWCQIILDGDNPTVWMIRVDKLKDYISKNEPKKKIVSGGDGNANLYLYGIDDIIGIFTRVDNVESTELTKLIKGILK
jgi:hypothetical protein